MNENVINLRQTALNLFSEGLVKCNARNAVLNSVKAENNELCIFDNIFYLAEFSEIYVIALGKAAMSMVIGLNEILAGRITAGVVSAPKSNYSLLPNWKIFEGGHPLPNEASFAAAKSAISLLKKANHKNSLIIFLISGGGSAIMELPRNENISLADLQRTNEVLVTCGAKISEINTIRRGLSRIKGGGLSNFAPLATQISLIISDTNRGDEANVASGPTITPNFGKTSPNISQIIEKYRLEKFLSANILESLDDISEPKNQNVNHSVFTIIDNQNIVETVADSIKKLGFVTKIAADLVETPIDKGCHELIKRFLTLQQTANGKPFAIISGGEFACPVRDLGIGGRNLESTLRCILEIENLKNTNFNFAILNAGTDGIDGNSPATGAIADETTLERAKIMKLNANKFLANSDSYNFFLPLNDAIITNPTGTNVRDIRILLGF